MPQKSGMMACARRVRRGGGSTTPSDYSLQATTKMAAVSTEPLRELVRDGSGVDGGGDCVDDWEASTGGDCGNGHQQDGRRIGRSEGCGEWACAAAKGITVQNPSG
jgi:hypothetical protein